MSAPGSRPPVNVFLDHKRIMDYGSGPMRLLSGLEVLGCKPAAYVGVDVSQKCIDWARQTFPEPQYRFHRLDLHNERYNPGGTPLQNLARLEIDEPEHGFDLIVLRSVFTHMRLGEMAHYLGQLTRFLAGDGRFYLSTFAEYGVPREEENPLGYKTQRTDRGPLHRVRINRHVFEDVVDSLGLEIRVFCQDVLDQPTFLLGRRASINSG